jgi:F-type H+-transporting ATPase subunit delta
MSAAVAKRYGKAIFELASERGELEGVGRELEIVVAAFATPDLARFAEDTSLDRNTRKVVAERVSEKLGLSRLVQHFLTVVAGNNRLRQLAAIQRVWQRLEDRALGRVRARVVSAEPLSDASRRRLVEIFARQTGKQIVEEAESDPALLGGVIVEIQGRVFDGSLRTRLERLKRSLAG